MSLNTIVTNSIINQKNNFDNFISNINYDEIISIVEKIERHNNNNIYFGGVGKSGNLALQFSDLLKSIGLNSFYIDIHRLTHGDLGIIKKDDLLFLFSKSGNTNEIIDIFDLLICSRIIITNNINGLLKGKIGVNDMYIALPLKNEDSLFNSIPSNSLVINQTYFNLIVDTYINKINYSLKDYKINHSGGSIGFNNKKISEFVDTEYISLNYEDNYTLKYCLELLTNSNCLCIIFNKNTKFYGILTLKDLIKLQLSNKVVNNENDYILNCINPYINSQSTKLDGNLYIKDYVEELQNYKISKLFPVIVNNECIGILDYKLILKYKNN